jgi:hypothetical protein
MFNRRLLLSDSGGKKIPTYASLEFHVENSSGSPIRSARVEVNYNGETNIATTDNKGVAYFEVQTNILISYTVTSAGYNAKTGTLTVETGTAYKVEYVTLTTPEPPLPTEETVLWKGSTVYDFTITIPPGVKVLKITTEYTEVDEFVEPNLPRYIGVTGGKTYNMRATVDEGSVPEPAYWSVEVKRYNSSSDFKQWVSSYGGDAPEGEITSTVQIIMSYSASINGVTPNVLDY